jgi:hypothetical protein
MFEGRGGEGEMGRWGDGEMGRWGEQGRNLTTDHRSLTIDY